MTGRAESLFAGIPADLPAELTDVLADGRHVRVERIVSRGHVSPPGFWYDQAEAEWVAVLCGRARLEFEKDGRTVDLTPGDHVTIAPHERHRVAWTDPALDTVWLAVFWLPAPV